MVTANRRILVIDDDQDIWLAYKAILTPSLDDSDSSLGQLTAILSSSNDKDTTAEDSGFNLSYAPQGKDGLQMVEEAVAENTPYALAIIDVRMPPGWDGMETAKRIRQCDPNVEIVIVTAYSDRSSGEITQAVGSPEKLLFFRKPFDPDELKQIAVSLTDKYQLARKEEYQRQELETLFSSNPAAIFIVDNNRIVQSWNNAAEEITGYSAEEVIGEQLIFDKISDSVHSLPGRREGDWKVAIRDQQISISNKSGETRVISLTLTRMPGRDKKDRKIIGSFWDITTLKDTEKALSLANIELRKQIKEKDTLREKQIKLVKKLSQAQKMEAIGMMAGGVAHDLNNILTGVVSYPDLLLMDLKEDSKMREAIIAIQESGKRAAEVVADLLTIARGVATEKQVADLTQLIVEYLDSAEGSILKSRYPNVKIRTHFADGITAITCSPIHIKKCLMNLLTNAAEALSTSGTVDIETDSLYIDQKRAKELDLQVGEYVSLVVGDNGPGIPKQDLDHIFEPFFSKKKIGRSGTGLGLAVVWNTVQDHQGAITVESSFEGTTFKMYFQSSTDLLPENRDIVHLDEIKGEGTILVVDDEQQQLDIVKALLTRLGYTVQTAGSGEKALKYLQDNTADLVLLDMLMHPGMNGYETYQKILKIHPTQEAIIVSGYSENGEVSKAQKIGAGSFISKPFGIEQLGLAIKTVLSKE